jgi:protein-L-isoaspartate(D-aspartate) O-methyltransferase
MTLQDLPRPRAEMITRLRERFPDCDRGVLSAMSEVPRHLFTERGFWHMAYSEASLPIGYGQTLSQPGTILRALSALCLSGTDTLLEVGSGSGYLAAVASRLCSRVYGVERILALVQASRKSLDSLSVRNVLIGYGDGRLGWQAHAPYSAVLCSAFSGSVPDAMVEQLAEGGRIAAPVGESGRQEFILWKRENGSLKELDRLFECSFVPLVEGGGTVHG